MSFALLHTFSRTMSSTVTTFTHYCLNWSRKVWYSNKQSVVIHIAFISLHDKA